MADAMLEKRRIAILLPCLLTGGTEVVTLDTARVFLGMGFVVDLIVYFDEIDPAMVEAARATGAAVVQLGVHREGGRLANAHLALALFKQLLAGRYELIWLQYMTPTLLPLLLAKPFARRLVTCVHVAANHYSQQGIKRIRWLARHWCNQFVCVSNTVACGIFGSIWCDPYLGPKVTVIPNCIDIDEVQRAGSRIWHDELYWPQDRLIVGYCGRLVRIKGADILIDSVNTLIKQGHNIGLILLGDGDEGERLRSKVRSYGIDNHVFFAGLVSRGEIYPAIKGFDIAVVPSRTGLEGFGMSALEAMCTGVPLIASNADSLVEVTKYGSVAVLFESGSVDDLTKALRLLISDPSLRKRLSASAFEHVRNSYSRQAFASRLSHLLKSIGLLRASES